jgi:hypothetical protein
VCDEPISPELALVCLDLRAKAIAVLPAQPWSSSRSHSIVEPLRQVLPATAQQATSTAQEEVKVARAVGVYFLARAADLLAITAGIAVFVLLLAAVAGVVRG